jgi:hypothetical protein
MILDKTKYFRILALSPSTTGFGFVVLEGTDTLADWGAKTVRKNKNEWCISQADKLIRKYEPNIVVLYDHASNPRRSERIRALNGGFIDLAKTHKLKKKLFSQDKVNDTFFPQGGATKYKIAKLIAERVPEELAHELPPKRRSWNSEKARMDIFDAFALAVTFRRWVA